MLFSIRIGIPAVLMIFTAVLSWWSLRTFSEFEMRRVETEAVSDLRLELTRLQAQVEYSFKNSDVPWLQEVISEYGTDSTVLEGLIVDESGFIRASIDLLDIGKTVGELKRSSVQHGPGLQEEMFKDVQESMQGIVRVTPDGSSLFGAYPYSLANESSASRDAKPGVIWFEYDLVPKKAEAGFIVRRQTLIFASGLLILSVVLGIVFHFRVARRIDKLVRGTQRIAAGDMATHVQMAAKDELGLLAQHCALYLS